MQEQMILFREKQQMAETFTKRVNPYEKPEPLNIDLRSYTRYLKEHNIDGKEPNNVAEIFTMGK